MDKQFDELFSKVENLTWLPWVGNNFAKAERRILLVAESHYCVEPDEQERTIQIEEMMNDKENTREIVLECPINGDWSNNMFANLHRTFFLNESFNSEVFWDNVAFYNFVQRPMNYSIGERPNDNDFYRGWQVFLHVIDILKPTDCIFIGVSAADYFNQSMAMLGIDKNCSNVEWIDGQGAYARRFSINRDWGTLTPLCIKHTSSYFSYDYWHGFLIKHYKAIIKYICSLQGLELNNMANNPQKSVDDNWLDDVPRYLSHKPIVACEYQKIDGEDSDAYYLTIGRAQYDNESGASVKIFRKGDSGNWSRQSEEVPITRVSDMAIMLVSSIKTLQTLDYSTGFTYLQENFVNEDDMPFIKQCISNDATRIKTSLRELKRMLNEIDIDSII